MLKKMLNSKDLHYYAKKGYNFEDLMKVYSIYDQKELLQKIKAATKDASILIRKFKQNEKLPKKGERSTESATKVAENETINVVNESAIEPEKQVEPETEKDDLAKLKEQESEYVRVCIELESAHKGYVSERRKKKEELSKIKDECNEILKRLVLLEKQEQVLSDEYQDAKRKMIECSEKLRNAKFALEDVRQRIKESESIIIYIDNNGKIEADHELPEVYGSDEEIFNTLITNPNSEYITVAGVKNIARLKRITKELEEEGRRYILLFEDDRMETLYQE